MMNRLKTIISDNAYSFVMTYKNRKIDIAGLRDRLDVRRWVTEDFQYLPETGNALKTEEYISQNKRMNEYDGILATKIVQIYKHTFFKILLTG